MLALLIVIGLLIAAFGADAAVMWGGVRLVGSRATFARALMVEGLIVATGVGAIVAGQVDPWVGFSSMVMKGVQALVVLGIEFGVIWCFIGRGFGLSRWRAAAVLGMRVGWTLVGIGVAILVIRPFVVEAFTPSGGSMSPTIVGRHMEGVCAKCGGTLIIPVTSAAWGGRRMLEGICQECRGVSSAGSAGGVDRGSDWILVNKFARPGRWDIAAYRTSGA